MPPCAPCPPPPWPASTRQKALPWPYTVLARVPGAPNGAVVALSSTPSSTRATTVVRHAIVHHGSLAGAEASAFHPIIATEKSNMDQGDRRTPLGLAGASPCAPTTGKPPRSSIAAVCAPSAWCTPQASPSLGSLHRRPRGGPRCTSPLVHREPAT